TSRDSHSSPVSYHTYPRTTTTYTLSLHDALPICTRICPLRSRCGTCGRQLPDCRSHSSRPLRASRWTGDRSARCASAASRSRPRSEEHTSELQSRVDLVCRLLLEKKKSVIRIDS